MKIIGVAWRGYAVPFRRLYVTSESEANTRYGLLLFLRDSNGSVGVGEASPVGVGSRRQVEETAELMERLAPRLLQTNLNSLEAAYRLRPLSIPSPLRFGLETALLDLEGIATWRSVAQLLGGESRPLPVNALIAEVTPHEAAARAREAVAQGFTSLKLKVGAGTIEDEEALVSSVRSAVGQGVRLRLDANGAWSVSTAIKAIQRLAPYGLEYVEQPVKASEIRGLKEVRSAVPVPIAADEALGSIQAMRKLLKADAADIFVIKLGRLGGLHKGMEAVSLAEKAGKKTVVTSSLELGVGLAASAHLASTLPSHPFAHGLATGLLLESDLLSAPLTLAHGELTPPKGPGLGVEVDMKALDRHSIDITGEAGSWTGSPLLLL